MIRADNCQKGLGFMLQGQRKLQRERITGTNVEGGVDRL